jgi:hypothetical protein
MNDELNKLEQQINASYARIVAGIDKQREAEHLLHLIVAYKILAHREGMRQGGVIC